MENGNGNGSSNGMSGNGNGHSNNEARPAKSISSTIKEFVAIGFRHKSLVRTAFLWSLLAGLLACYIFGLKFQSNFEVLIKHDRVDPAITPDDNPRPQLPTDASATTIDITNESELLQSDDLLEQVVDACPMTMWGEPKVYTPVVRAITRMIPGYDDARKPQAVAKLASDLQVSVVSSTGLMQVSYSNGDPVQAACVTMNLTRLYMDKHLAVNRMPKVYDFFAKQADTYHKQLLQDEAKMVEFAKDQNAVQANNEATSAVQKGEDFLVALNNDKKSVQALEEQLAEYNKLKDLVTKRITTQTRETDDAILMASLGATLNSFETQRAALVLSYDPSYRLVKDLDEQIAQTKKFMSQQHGIPLTDTTFDVNPVWEWLDQSITQAQGNLTSLKAQTAADQRIVDAYHQKALEFTAKGVTQDDLTREVNAAQANYLLYLGKREQARIQDMLDERRVLNVSIAEPPTRPDQTLYSPLLLIALAFIFAGMIAIGAALIADYMDPSFRTPDEVREFLDVPVFAAIPENGYEVPVSGPEVR